MFDFAGKKAFITGGTRGIGLAIATKMARAGADVALNYLRNKKAAEEAVAKIKAISGKEPLLLKGNVAKDEDIDEMFKVLRDKWGGISFLVSNAASGVLKPSKELTYHHWQWTMDINAYALLALSRSAVPMMKGNGRIVAVSSLGATHAFNNYAAVGSSKAALESLVRHLCVEYAEHGINVNAVSASVVDTEALTHFPNRDTMLNDSLVWTPAKKLVEPDDVADGVMILCSDLTRMVHGHTFIIDGGLSIKLPG
ncbi:SDR family oxidoreductase [bacterium]|nr:MAG: SDR family oxidoreductase [bacterium]MCQ3951585.1 enoyl-ACP reductase [Planctomycetota bacterium]NUO16663.1 SDR family oxidoreductase [Planctomycetaceae bacterium]RIK65706.1 MAG: enoyl-ACP reductase [Planctomycetota bacterium]GIK51671.1 MAG: enoyl-[acyl-carrier-protein] reductase [Planctomycetota bacterium]